MKKKILSILLSLVMVVAMIPMMTGISFAEVEPAAVDDLWINGEKITAEGTYTLGEGGNGTFSVSNFSDGAISGVKVILHSATISAASPDSQNAGICYTPATPLNKYIYVILDGENKVVSNTMNYGLYANCGIRIIEDKENGADVNDSLDITTSVSEATGIYSAMLVMIEENIAVSISSPNGSGITTTDCFAYGGTVNVIAGKTAITATAAFAIFNTIDYDLKSTTGVALDTTEIRGNGFAGSLYASGKTGACNGKLENGAYLFRAYGSTSENANINSLSLAYCSADLGKLVMRGTDAVPKTIQFLGTPEIEISDTKVLDANCSDVLGDGKVCASYSDKSKINISLTDVAIGKILIKGVSTADVEITLNGTNTIGASGRPVDTGIFNTGGALIINGDSNSKLTIYDNHDGIKATSIDLSNFKGKMTIFENNRESEQPPCCLSAIGGTIIINGGTYDLRSENNYAINAKDVSISDANMYLSGVGRAINADNSLSVTNETATGSVDFQAEAADLTSVSLSELNYSISDIPVKTLQLTAEEEPHGPFWPFWPPNFPYYSSGTIEVEKTKLTEAEVKKLVNEMTVVARTENQTRGIKVYVNTVGDLDNIKDAGYKVVYDFYKIQRKSVPTNSQYKLTKICDKVKGWYLNTDAKIGNKYYYKVVLKVINTDGKVIAKTTLDQGRYGCRTRA